RYQHNLLSKQALDEYFMNFYQRNKVNITYPVESIRRNLYTILMQPRQEEIKSYNAANESSFNLLLRAGFETVSKHFQVIDNLTSSVIVPHEEGVDLIAQLNRGLSIDEITNTLKKLQMYSVQVYSQELNDLDGAGALVSH